jgi:hypothetical protein
VFWCGFDSLGIWFLISSFYKDANHIGLGCT